MGLTAKNEVGGETGSLTEPHQPIKWAIFFHDFLKDLVCFSNLIDMWLGVEADVWRWENVCDSAGGLAIRFAFDKGVFEAGGKH